MVSVFKPLLFSVLTFVFLATVGTLFSALSNNASTLTHKLSFNGRRKDACTDDSDFYDRSFPIEDRVVDPRDLVRMRERKLPTGAFADTTSNLWKEVMPTGEVEGTGKVKGGDSDLLPRKGLPVVQLPVGHSLNHQILYFGSVEAAAATAEGPRKSLPLSLPLLPYKRVYELVGLAEGGYGYEVKVSFLGSPPTNFDLKLFTLPSSALDINTTDKTEEEMKADEYEEEQNSSCPSGYRACPCEGNDEEKPLDTSDESEKMHESEGLFLASGGMPNGPIRSDASSASNANDDDSKSTRRRVLDIEKVMFKSAAIGTAEKFAAAVAIKTRRKGRHTSMKGIAEEKMDTCNEKHVCCCRGNETSRMPPPHPPPGAGAVYLPNVVTIDKTVAIPYEPEHVVRHFESVATAAHEFGISFLLPQGTPTTSEDTQYPQNRGKNLDGGEREWGGGDIVTTLAALSVTDPFDRAVLYVRDQLTVLSKAFLGLVVGEDEQSKEEPQREGAGKTAHPQPNRLFVIVSAYPKGESKDQRRQRQGVSDSSSRRIQRGGAVSELMLSTGGGTAEEDEEIGRRCCRRFEAVKFNINLERMYFGQFPLGIFIGLVTGWPVATVLWVAVVPRVVAVARARVVSKKNTMW